MYFSVISATPHPEIFHKQQVVRISKGSFYLATSDDSVGGYVFEKIILFFYVWYCVVSNSIRMQMALLCL